jgi:subtilisin-like proprotein convertase family protein
MNRPTRLRATTTKTMFGGTAMHLTRQPRLLGTARTLLCAAMLFAGTAGAQTSFTGAGAGAIPDSPGGGAGVFGTPLDVTFAVSGMTAPLTNVSLNFTATHTWIGDLEVVLAPPGVVPGGAGSFVVFSRVGAATATSFGDSSNVGGLYTFENAATQNIWAVATAAACGTDCIVTPQPYRTVVAGPTTNPAAVTDLNAAFAALTTAQANGTWTLRFRDGGVGDTGSVTAATLVLTGAPTDVPPQFAYAPAAGTTVTATGGGAVGTTGTLTITPSIATAGAGTGPAATTTLTCTAPTAPFAGFGQTVTAVGAGAIGGGPLGGTCTLGAAAATQTLTCNESRGGTANARTWTIECPAGSLSALTSTPVSGSTVPLGPRILGGPAATATIQFVNPNASAVAVTCTAPAAAQFTVAPLSINVPANGNASTTVSYSSATIGAATGTLSCTAGAQTFTFTLTGSTIASAVSVDTIGPLGKLLLLLALLGVGLQAIRRL